LSQTLEETQVLVARGEVRISLHGYEELAADNILVHDVIAALATAVVVEDYPDYPKGPCVLVGSTIVPHSLFTSSGASPRIIRHRR
jgi:hypothetical protein